MVEISLLVPWLVFSFVGAFDFGIYAYALISTQNAARTAAMASATAAIAQNGTALSSTACSYALDELRNAPGVGASLSTCSSPVTVTAQYLASGADQLPTVRVSVTYQTMQVIPLPGLMAGSWAITRTVEMPIRG